MLEVEGALVAGHAVEQYLQHPTQDTLLWLCHWYCLKKWEPKKKIVIEASLGFRCVYSLMKLFQIFEYNHACLHCTWVNAGTPVHMHTCTMISKVSRIIILASVARLPSISASCSSSALVLQSRNRKTLTRNDYDSLIAYERLQCGFQSLFIMMNTSGICMWKKKVLVESQPISLFFKNTF